MYAFTAEISRIFKNTTTGHLLVFLLQVKNEIFFLSKVHLQGTTHLCRIIIKDSFRFFRYWCITFYVRVQCALNNNIFIFWHIYLLFNAIFYKEIPKAGIYKKDITYTMSLKSKLLRRNFFFKNLLILVEMIQ